MHSSISLLPGDIHLWLAYYDEIDDPQLHDRYRSLLSDAERNQEPKFYFERDRRRYLVTRALVRTVLSKYLSLPPRDWVFSQNAFGRPEIANGEVRGSQLSFNVSHTHSLIVLGVAESRALGVDCENVVAREASIDIADHYFAPEEVRALADVPAHRQQYRFFEYWTFKESYIKARGMGLSLPLDKFSFRYPDDRRVAISIDPELKDESRRWQFWQFRPRPEYLVAVCAERAASAQSTPLVREIVPLRKEEILAPTFLRTSE